jgi:uncharacterized protein YecT (DUF1311 family)
MGFLPESWEDGEDYARVIGLRFMNLFFSTGFFVALNIMPFSAMADDTDRSLGVELCQPEENYQKADTELSITYKNILDNMNDGKFDDYRVSRESTKTSLIKSQKRWISFRDANCEAYYTLMSGGTSRNTDKIQCLIQMTQERNIYLKKTYF